MVRDPDGILDLPEGFTYQVLSRAGQVMDDGLLLPGAPDGMAAFPGVDGRIVLVRNHELQNAPAGRGAFGWRRELVGRIPTSKLYDAGVDREPNVPVRSRAWVAARRWSGTPRPRRSSGSTSHSPAPSGTAPAATRPGAAGSPAKSRSARPGRTDGAPTTATTSRCPPTPPPASPSPSRSRRWVDSTTRPSRWSRSSGIVYQTEDRQDGLFTRFLPDEPGNLKAGGRLQALSVVDRPSLDTRNWVDNGAHAQGGGAGAESIDLSRGDGLRLNEVVEVRWIDLDDVDTPLDDLRYRAFDLGAARFARAEGIWHSDDGVFLACTTGGRERIGQIFRYVPSRFEGRPEEERFPGRLELFLEPNDHTLVKNADNLTIHPLGDLVVCEDAGEGNRLVGVTPEGRLYPLGRNVVSKSEFAGSCFSPDGGTLFVNIQGDGLTLAISGFPAA